MIWKKKLKKWCLKIWLIGWLQWFCLRKVQNFVFSLVLKSCLWLSSLRLKIKSEQRLLLAILHLGLTFCDVSYAFFDVFYACDASKFPE